MSTPGQPGVPQNRIIFESAHENVVNGMYNFMQERNAILDAIITYLKTTNTAVTTNPSQGAGQPGAVTEALINTVKKLRDETLSLTLNR